MDNWRGSLGRADDGSGLQERLDDALIARSVQVHTLFGGQVVCQQPPCLFGGQVHEGEHAMARVRAEAPPSPLGVQVPGPLDGAAHPDGHDLTVGSADGTEPVRIGLTQGVEDRPGEIHPKIAWSAERLKELLAVDPVLGDFAELVEPHGYRPGVCPRDRAFEAGRVLTGQGVDNLRAAPSQQVCDNPGAETSSGAYPLVLQVVQPSGETAVDLLDARRGDGAVIVVALTGEPTEVVSEEMAAQVEHAPARAGRWPGPVAGKQLVEQFEESAPFHAEQRSGIVASIGVPLRRRGR